MSQPINELHIRRMVEDFYDKVRADALLGPVFESRLAGHWPAHLDKMVDFWSSALLRTGRYGGNPRSVHAAIPELTPKHFERWLELFAQTLATTFEGSVAAQIHGRAQAMAKALMRSASNRHSGLPMTESRRESVEHT